MRRLFPTALVFALLATPCQAEWSSDPTANLQITSAAGSEAQPKVVATPDGGCWISWFDGGSGYDVRVQKLDDLGDEIFASGGILVADRSFSSTQDYGLDVDASGGALLTFRDDRFTGIQITAARVTSSGVLVWGTNGVQLTNTTSFVASPKICGTSDGGAVVTWTEDSSARVQKLDGMGGTPWGGPGLTLTPATGSYSPSDVHDAGNDAILAFVHQTGSFGSPRHLYAQKIAGVNGALLWGATHVAVFDGGSLQFGNFPEFAPDGTGGAVFSWYDTSGSLQSYAQRVTTAGTEAFPHNGVAVSTDGTRVRVSPSADFDTTASETFVFWKEQNQAQSQAGVYGQKLDASGNRQWGATGVVVVPLGTDDITMVRCVPASFGTGAFAFWSAAPSFGQDRLYGMRLDASGVPDVALFDVASTPSNKSRLDVAKLATGMSALVWSDERTGSGDIYTQNVNPDGTLGMLVLAVPVLADVAGGGFLGAPAPNPTAAGATIRYTIPAGMPYTLDVVDVRGRLVRELAAGTGPRSEVHGWDGRDRAGTTAAGGVYFFRLKTGGGIRSERLVRLR